MRAAFSVLIIALAMPMASRAEPDTGDELQHWIPSLAISAGLLAQDVSGNSFAGPVKGPVFEPNPQLIRPPSTGDGTMVTGHVGLSLELMTPRLARALSHPRLFAHAGVAEAFGSTRKVAEEGAVDALAAPPVFEGLTFAEFNILGQGSQTTAQLDKLLVSAGGGVAFTVDWAGTRLRIKPSIEYFREVVELQGVVHRAVSLVGRTNATNIDDISDVRLIELAATTSKAYHGVGPGLEIEADVERIGPFMWTVFLSGQATAFIGDLELSTTATNQYGEIAGWSIEKDRWAYRANAGVRFRWAPE